MKCSLRCFFSSNILTYDTINILTLPDISTNIYKQILVCKMFLYLSHVYKMYFVILINWYLKIILLQSC